MDIDLLQWNNLRNWTPKQGDWVLYNGLFIAWSGVILGVSDTKIHVRYDGSPLLMVLNGDKQKYKYIDIDKIRYSRGNYIIFRVVPHSNMPLWFIPV